METVNTLGLRIPERTAAPAGAFLVNPKEVEEWVQSLPMANVGETSRQVFKTIVEFNRLEIPNLVRIKVVELFRQPIRYISENLHKYYFDVPFPLSAKNRKISVLNRELYAELSIAYKIFIENMISGSQGKFDRKLLIIAIHRTMRCLARVVYYSSIVYDPVPANVWKEIHRLYAYAEQNNIHELPVKSNRDTSGSSSIGSLYRQILLFSISSPYRLRQREIDQVFNKLPEWSELTSILESPDITDREGQFVSHLASDAPPSHLELHGNQPGKRSRILDTRKLVKRLHDTFDGMLPEPGSGETRTDNGQFSGQFIRQLMQAFGTAPKRGFVRTKLNFELKTAVGLSSVHTLLQNDEPPQPEPAQTPPEPDMDWFNSPGTPHVPGAGLYGRHTPNLSVSASNTPFDMETVIPEHTITGLGGGNTPTWAAISGEEQETETFSCRTINESAGGYCINWHGPEAPKIRIGEIVGIQSATDSRQFGIGISRWMRNNPGQGLQLGLEMIASSSMAVLLRRTGRRDFSNMQQKGILLPELRASGQPASLIAPTLPFKAGDTLRMSAGLVSREIRLTRLLESTGAFTHFQFVDLTIEKERMQGSRYDDSDFDNIWSTL